MNGEGRPGGGTETANQLAKATPKSSGIAAWKRRHAAARRLAPLDCGCPDPWPCRCTDPPLSENALDGWRAAALHLIAAGQIPLVPLEVRRALYRRPADRELAEFLHEACAGAIA